jgi:hypothetical protein
MPLDGVPVVLRANRVRADNDAAREHRECRQRHRCRFD